MNEEQRLLYKINKTRELAESLARNNQLKEQQFLNIEQQRQQKRDEQQEKRELFLEKKAVQQLRVDMIKSNVLQYQMKRANQVRQLHVSAEQMVEMERTRLEDLNRMRANKIKQNEVQMLNYKHDLMQRKIDNNDYK